MKPELTAEQYEIERAICDKADAYFDAHCETHKGGWCTLSAELAANPDYKACDNAMRGRVEQYEILRDLPETIFAYIGSGMRNGMGCDRIVGQSYPVTVWTGLIIGSATRGTSWRQGWVEMYQFYARVGGREYTGRGQGEGMYIKLRETAESKRKRAAQ